MQENSADIVAAWTHATADIPARGLDVSLNASAEACAALARTLEIVAVNRLMVRYRITAHAGDRYRLKGTVEAEVVQACVVTLEPVAANLSEVLDVEFRPDGAVAEVDVGSPEEELRALEAEEHEPIENNSLAVGRVVMETLAASLPPYPRAPDAALEQHEAGPAQSAASSPFAALAGWKPRTD